MSQADGWQRGTPASVGVDPGGIVHFLDRARSLGLELHSFMLFRAGQVIAEGWWKPYAAHRPHMLHSLTKSFTACGVGLAVEAGLFGLDDKLALFFPEQVPTGPVGHLGDITVRDLLTMRTGHAQGISGGAWRQLQTSWVSAFFRTPVPEPPGQRFVYSSASSYMLSALVQRCSGVTLHDFLRPRLLEPLGMSDFTWDLCPNGVNPGGNGVSCLTSDLLRLGILHLQGGLWNGRQLLPRRWVEQATRASVAEASASDAPERHLPLPTGHSGPPPMGYGYHWWVGPGSAYYASGLFGQYSIVLPEQDAVLAVTAALGQSDRRLLDLVWQDLRPALGAGCGGGADALRLADLALDLPPLGASPADRPTQCYDIQPNADGVRSVALGITNGVCAFTLEDVRGTHSIRAGFRQWMEGTTTMSGAPLHHQYEPAELRVVAGAVWEDDRTLVMTWVFVETAFRDQVVLRFADQTVRLSRSVNVNTAALSRPALQGRLRSNAIP